MSENRFRAFTTMTRDALFLTSLIVAMVSAVGSFAFKLSWPIIIERLQTDLNMATRDDVSLIQKQIDRLSGEDKIIRMAAGHSFVGEPVSIGEPIELTLVMSRTPHGMACHFVSATPLFTDGRNIPFAAEMILPIKQIGPEMDRLKLTLNPPEALQAGRVGVALGLRYNCPFGTDGAYIDVFDETPTVFFQMDPLPN